jgi:DNA-directed RNA polymerase specialized sigma24 family protein
VGGSGEEEFERFFRGQARSLMRQAYLLTGDAGEAQDLVQETMIRAWREWPRLQGYDDPGAWARHVLHRLAIGRWRRLTVRRRHDRADLRVVPAVDGDTLSGNGVVDREIYDSIRPAGTPAPGAVEPKEQGQLYLSVLAEMQRLVRQARRALAIATRHH